jgi:hypothetical protein
MAWDDFDPREYDKNHDDRTKIIDEHRPVPCRICERVFSRLRATYVFYHDCKEGVCEGEHGRQVPNSPISKCVACWPKPN